MKSHINFLKFNLQLLVCYVASSALNIHAERTAANYLHNVDIIILRQLKNPVVEDSHGFEDLRDNLDEYNKLLKNLIESVKKKDAISILTAKQYGSKGIPKFLQEAKNTNIFLRLEMDYDWPVRETRIIVSLIDRAKVLWKSLHTWYEQQSKQFYQNYLIQPLDNRKH